jgi:hypothetical protein
VQDAYHVDIKHAAEDFSIELLGRFTFTIDAGIEESPVESAERFRSVVEGCGHSVAVGSVGDAAAGGGTAAHGGRHGFFPGTSNPHLMSCRGEVPGAHIADPARSASDHVPT